METPDYQISASEGRTIWNSKECKTEQQHKNNMVKNYTPHDIYRWKLSWFLCEDWRQQCEQLAWHSWGVWWSLWQLFQLRGCPVQQSTHQYAGHRPLSMLLQSTIKSSSTHPIVEQQKSEENDVIGEKQHWWSNKGTKTVMWDVEVVWAEDHGKDGNMSGLVAVRQVHMANFKICKKKN